MKFIDIHIAYVTLCIKALYLYLREWWKGIKGALPIKACIVQYLKIISQNIRHNL